MGGALLICDINDDVYVGVMLLPLDRKGSDSVIGVGLAGHFPHLVLFLTVPLEDLAVEREPLFTGSADLRSHEPFLLFLIAVQDFLCIHIDNEEPLLPFAEHLDHQLVIALDHLGAVLGSYDLFLQFSFPCPQLFKLLIQPGLPRPQFLNFRLQ